MNSKALLELTYFLQVGMSLIVLTAIVARKAYKVFPQLPVLLGVNALQVSVSIAMLFFRRDFSLGKTAAYNILFYSSWTGTALSCVLQILIIYSVFSEAMRPMSGLHEAGKLIFRWVGVASLLIAFAIVAGPGVFSSFDGFNAAFGHLQQGISVLTICLLAFVCFAIRPLGLTFRSHIFGVSLGLGVTAVVELIEAAWMVTQSGQSLYSPIYIFSGVGLCVALVVWGVYFAAPEPARRMILLPTTSPFFFWNRISEILGDAPGHVAVAGFTPSMLAPAEIEMLTAATAGEAEDADTAPHSAGMLDRFPVPHAPDYPVLTQSPSLAL